MLGRRILVAILIPYVLWLTFSYEYHLVDGVNLAAHEAGHMVFRFFGQTMHFLGGTIGQLFFPIAFIVHMLRRGRRFDAAILAIWLAESLMYMAEYLGDAKVQVLPLVGGHIHDWNWLLLRAGLLAHCEIIAALVHVFASMLAIAALSWAAWRVRPGAEDLEPSSVGLNRFDLSDAV